MIVDVILTIAVIPAAFGAVTEFKLRIGNVGFSAYGAFVPVRRRIYHSLLWTGCRTLHIRTGPVFIGLFMDSGLTAQFALQEVRKYIDTVCAEEQEIVQQCE